MAVVDFGDLEIGDTVYWPGGDYEGTVEGFREDGEVEVLIRSRVFSTRYWFKRWQISKVVR